MQNEVLELEFRDTAWPMGSPPIRRAAFMPLHKHLHCCGVYLYLQLRVDVFETDIKRWCKPSTYRRTCLSP